MLSVYFMIFGEILVKILQDMLVKIFGEISIKISAEISVKIFGEISFKIFDDVSGLRKFGELFGREFYRNWDLFSHSFLSVPPNYPTQYLIIDNHEIATKSANKEN